MPFPMGGNPNGSRSRSNDPVSLHPHPTRAVPGPETGRPNVLRAGGDRYRLNLWRRGCYGGFCYRSRRRELGRSRCSRRRRHYDDRGRISDRRFRRGELPGFGIGRVSGRRGCVGGLARITIGRLRLVNRLVRVNRHVHDRLFHTPGRDKPQACDGGARYTDAPFHSQDYTNRFELAIRSFR